MNRTPSLVRDTHTAWTHIAWLWIVLITWPAFAFANDDAGTDSAEATKPDVLIVLDRGTSAKEGARTRSQQALLLANAFHAAGYKPRIAALTSTESGAARIRKIKLNEESFERMEKSENFAFARPSGVGLALRTAARRVGSDQPMWLILMGPFLPGEVDEDIRAKLEQGAEKWNESAPSGSRIFAWGLSDAARATLIEGEHPATNVALSGHFVSHIQSPSIDCLPFTRIGTSEDDPPPPLVAKADFTITTLSWGSETSESPIQLVSAQRSDTIETSLRDDGTKLTATVTRNEPNELSLTLSVAAPHEDSTTILLCERPESATSTWSKHARKAVLWNADGSSATPFHSANVTTKAPAKKTYLLAFPSGETPKWNTGSHLPKGVTATFGNVSERRPGVSVQEVLMTFVPPRGLAEPVQGAISIQCDGWTTTPTIDYQFVAAAPKATLEVVSEEVIQELPQPTVPTVSSFRIRDDNGQTPNQIDMVAELLPESWRNRVRLSLTDDRDRSRPWPHGEALKIERDRVHEIAANLVGDGPLPVGEETGSIRLRPKDETVAWLRGRDLLADVSFRRPTIRVSKGMTAFSLRGEQLVRITNVEELLAESTHRADSSLNVPEETFTIRVRIDPDGIDGERLMDLIRTPPTLTVIPAYVQDWELRLIEPGLWNVEPVGPWKGSKRGAFSATHHVVEFSITWPHSSVVEHTSTEIRIPAKVGSSGWLFLGLGLLAALIGIFTVLQFRPPPAKGTLLYTVEGLDRAVGRLPLSPVGRRKADITSTKRGKLEVSGNGDVVAEIQPTRVGPMIVAENELGTRERKLLVDGLALRTGRHTMRYVSDQPDEDEATERMADIPDLFGDEFDIETGRVDATWREIREESKQLHAGEADDDTSESDDA